MDCLYEIIKKFSAFVLTHYHRWIYENHKIEFQTKAIETIYGLTKKHDTRSNTRKVPNTFVLVSQIRILD